MNELHRLVYTNVDPMNAQLQRYTSLFSGQTGTFSSCNFPWPAPDPITDDEKKLFEIVPEGTKYVIGYLHGDCGGRIHAISHAAYYLDEIFRKDIHETYNSIDESTRIQIHDEFISLGYKEERIIDEFGAYAVMKHDK